MIEIDSSTARFGSLLGAGIALGIFFLTIGLDGLGPTTDYIRYAAFGLSGGVVVLTFVSGFWRRRTRTNSFAVLAFTYFICAWVQDTTQGNTTLAVLDLFGAVLSLAATQTNLSGLLLGFRHWFLILIIICLLPAFFGQGYSPGREWFALFPGRYFGFSNPDAFGFIAGIGILLSIPVLRSTRGRVLASLSLFLFILSSTNSAAIAAALAVAAYSFFWKARVTKGLQVLVVGMATATMGALLWIPTTSGMSAFALIAEKFSLSSRTTLWLSLLQETRHSKYFWTGLGDQAVANYTFRIGELSTAHTTILQMLLSKGFPMTVFFILVAATAAVRVLARIQTCSSRDQRLAIAVVVYWFVSTLVSSEPGKVMVFALVIVVAMPRLEDDARVIVPRSLAKRSP